MSCFPHHSVRIFVEKLGFILCICIWVTTHSADVATQTPLQLGAGSEAVSFSRSVCVEKAITYT